jgi:hypothetical protein
MKARQFWGFSMKAPFLLVWQTLRLFVLNEVFSHHVFPYAVMLNGGGRGIDDMGRFNLWITPQLSIATVHGVTWNAVEE